MPDVPDLSKLRERRENGAAHQNEAAFEALSPEEQEALAAKAAEHQPGHACRTAFIVYIDRDGTVQATPDLDFKIQRDALPGADDVYGAAAVLQKDLGAQETAENVLKAQMQMAAQIKQQQHDQRLLQNLGDPRGPGPVR